MGIYEGLPNRMRTLALGPREPCLYSDQGIVGQDKLGGSLHFELTLLRRHPWRGLLAVAVCAVTISFVWSFTSSAWTDPSASARRPTAAASLGIAACHIRGYPLNT